MLHYIFYPLKDLWFGFNVFKYLTFRAAMASVTALLISLLIGPCFVRWLKRLSFGQYIRRKYVEDIYKLHKHKEGTPTMGGLLIIFSIVVSTILWADITNRYVVCAVTVLVLLGAVGFFDDYIKVVKKNNSGLPAKTKFLLQALIAVTLAVFILTYTPVSPSVTVPFFKDQIIHLGLWYILIVVLVISGTSNAVNLTDGLDGLAIGCTIMVALGYAVLSYITGNFSFSDYLNVFYLPGAGELSIFCAAIVGAGLGFLWFNAYPANVFMGDTGSLALGGALGAVAVFIKKELLLLIIGGIFVIEAASVLLQVAWFKATKKRLFLKAPIHHHFQVLGWHESKIIIRFWIVAIILVLITLATLKLQ